MCWKDDCKTCGKATWAGCGLHIDSALRGISEEARCPGWKTGRCTLSDGQAPCQHTCPDCGMSVQASTDDFLNEVIQAHKKKPFMGLKSQCEKRIAGLI
mmetsp:Transcript_21229/g.36247  ORF Transcript_21229/g.36247 Transcript_21229/m.36247 type:complete len:99 (-) Transcript_21229:142-438(-)